MNEDIKAAFERVAKEYDARAEAARQQRDQELTERQQFEAGYQNKRDEVILPALRFVTTILEPRGWTCKISDSAASTKFEVFRGNMRGASTARPHTFTSTRRNRVVFRGLANYARPTRLLPLWMTYLVRCGPIWAACQRW